MLPFPNRLRRRRDFGVAIRGGRRAGSATLVVHLAVPADAAGHGRGEPPVRVGFVVSRACGPAVIRNQIRRRLRHLALHRLPELPPGALIVVRALPASASATAQRLGDDLDRCLERATASAGSSPS